MRHLAILGASGHGKVVADAALAQGWGKITFFDDSWPSVVENGHWPVVGNTESLIKSNEAFDAVVVAIGNNEIRQKKLTLLGQYKLQMATIVHPAAMVSEYAVVGEGTVVLANSVINVDAQLGIGAIVNTGAVIEHDCRLGDCVHVSPNAVLAGGVSAEDLVWIGAGATLKQLVSVGEHAMVGMGCVVLRDVGAGQTVVGNPARVL